MDRRLMGLLIGGVLVSLAACSGGPTLAQLPAPNGQPNAGQGAGGGGGGNGGGGGGGGDNGGGGGGGVGGGTPCWVGDWLSQDSRVVLDLGSGISAPLEGGANIRITMQANGVMQQDFTHSGALNGYETAPGLGQTPVSVQYSGRELDQVSATGDTSGTISVKVEVPARFTLVSGDQTTTQDDAVQSVTTSQFTCSATRLVTMTANGQTTYLRVG